MRWSLGAHFATLSTDPIVIVDEEKNKAKQNKIVELILRCLHSIKTKFP